jgi:uncharacterized protein (DUF2252 family)
MKAKIKDALLEFEKRRARGQQCRNLVRRVDQGEWPGRGKNFDPVEFILSANRGRLRELLPIKWGRMAATPFGFFRGAVPLMAQDLSKLAVTDLHCQICGDAHVRNFGAYAATGGRLVFDINDFDETINGPWEWDVKRMAASLVLGGREAGNSDEDCRAAVRAFVRAYRSTLAQLAKMPIIEIARFEVNRHLRVKPIVGTLHKAQRATPLENLKKMTTKGKHGMHLFREQKPLLSRLRTRIRRQVLAALREYRNTLACQHQHFFDQYRPVDVAFKVVGTGSVGLRDYVVLLFGVHNDDPLFLQIKEEPPSAYAHYFPKQYKHENQGQRVVEGQKRMQSHSDLFLGWARIEGRDYLVRQLRDHKATVDSKDLKGKGLLDYANVCGELLAKGHARSGDPCALSGYCGNSTKLDRAIAKFAFAYAAQTESDYDKFCSAIRRGRVHAQKP